MPVYAINITRNLECLQNPNYKTKLGEALLTVMPTEHLVVAVLQLHKKTHNRSKSELEIRA